jgi:nucleotide-binding universal stress UspA family protein
VSSLARVLVALDGSPTAAGALTFAFDLSREYNSSLILCTAVDQGAAMVAASPPDGAFLGLQAVLDEYEAAAKTVLDAALARATAAGAQASTVLLDGHPAAQIIACAQQSAVDAIVVGTEGKHGFERLFLGSTAEGVVRLTTVPTFVVHQPHEAPGAAAAALPARKFERILVAIDDSDPSDAALAFALDLAALKQSLVLCCSVVESDELLNQVVSYGYEPAPLLEELRQTAAALIEAKAGAAQARGLTIESIIVEGKVPDAILDAAAAYAADIIVMGTHGRRGLRRLFIGSVAESVIRRSVLPVAVVREQPAKHAR